LNCLVPYKLFCSMVHQWFMKYNNFRYCKFFCWYFIEFICINLVDISNCVFWFCHWIVHLMILCNVLMLHSSFCNRLILKIWWPLGLSIVMNVNFSHGEKNFLCKFVVSIFCLVLTKLNLLFYLSLNSQNSFFLIFWFFQSP